MEWTPAARRNSCCSAVSTPSAVTFMPSPRPRLTTACTIAAASAAFSIECTKLRSILSLSKGKAAQIKQARIAGAEIVEREPHAERLEPEHGELGGVDVAEQRALGDFEFEPGRVEIGFGENALHHVDEIGAAELQRRDVDRDRDARPGLAVEAGAAQHPFAERDDEPAVLGDRDEFGRRNLAALPDASSGRAPRRRPPFRRCC